MRQSSCGGPFGTSTSTDFYVRRPMSQPGRLQLNVGVGVVVSYLFENNAAGDTGFPSERHCAMTNADEANQVQTMR